MKEHVLRSFSCPIVSHLASYIFSYILEHEDASHLDALEVSTVTVFSRSLLIGAQGAVTKPLLIDACSPPEEISNGKTIRQFFFLNCIRLVCPLFFFQEAL